MNDFILDTSKFQTLAMLTPEEIEDLSKATQIFNYAADVPILYEGQIAEGIYMVDQGELVVSKRHNNSVFYVGHILEGDMFGETSLLYGIPSTAEVRTHKNSVLFRLPPDAVFQAMESNGTFQRHMEYLANYYMALSALAVNPMFSMLPQTVRETIVYNGKVRDLAAGDILLREGDEDTRSMYLILKGKANISLQDPYDTSRETVFDSISAGDEVGELSRATGKIHTITVTAITSLRVISIDNHAIHAYINRYEAFADAYTKLVEHKRIQRHSAMNGMVSKVANKELEE
ncbi:MAG: cyclic nucleotide-binding domain-containing protein [Mariprofundales bacterium]